MKTALVLILTFALLPTAVFATPDDDRFQKLAGEYIEQYLQTYPEQATGLGDHRFDDRLTDYSAEARTKRLADAKAFREKLNGFGPEAKLSATNSVDLRILKDSVDYQDLRSRGTEGRGLEPARVQPEPGQQPLPPRRPRFRYARKAYPESA